MSRYSNNSDYSGSYAPPNDRLNGGVYREIDPRSERFAAHVLQGPFTGFGNKKSSRHSSSSHKDHHGFSRSSRSSTSISARYTSTSTRGHQQQQFQQQQQSYPGAQSGYRPGGGLGYGPGYGPGVQQRQPDTWGQGQQQRSGGWGTQGGEILTND